MLFVILNRLQYEEYTLIASESVKQKDVSLQVKDVTLFLFIPQIA
jgi:hypothetical protein